MTLCYTVNDCFFFLPLGKLIFSDAIDISQVDSTPLGVSLFKVVQ